MQTNPALGLTLSAASHPILDMIPHWDFGWGWKKKSKRLLFFQSTFDLGLGLILSYLLFGQSVTDFRYFLSCILLSEVWDILEAPYWFLGWRFPPFSWIYNIQSKLQGKTKTVQMGLLTQALTVTGLIIILKFL